MHSYSSTIQIIQTFFVASISGGLIEGLGQFQTVGDVFRFLAATLPPQSEFFIQLVLIDAVLVLGLEILRSTALIKAGLRRCIGPRLTEKERDSPYMSCRPLSNPRDFLFAHIYSAETLTFMVLFVFTLLAPIISYILAFAFLIMELGNRHQFFYIYPSTPDSGGRIWMEFISVCLCCMPVAEAILLTALGLGQAHVAVYVFIPLLVASVLFVLYVRFRYFPIFVHLPSEDCAEADARSRSIFRDFSFVLKKYRQPALFERVGEDEEHGQRDPAQDNANIEKL